MYSIVLAAKASNCTDRPARASVIASATDSVVCSMPSATSVSPAKTWLPSTRTGVPSLSLVKTSLPTPSTSGMPASTRMPGPRFG
jgi:hypothetical protein